MAERPFFIENTSVLARCLFGLSKKPFARLFDPSCHGQFEIPPGWSNSHGTVDAIR